LKISLGSGDTTNEPALAGQSGTIFLDYQNIFSSKTSALPASEEAAKAKRIWSLE
jgi:hypothetical protein